MIPISGVSLLLTGATSTSLFLHQRQMRAGPVVRLEIVSHAIGIAATVALAYVWHDAWAIVYGGLVGVLAKVVGTYVYLKGGVVGFQWERSIVVAIVRFGRWVFVATLLTFLDFDGGE
jgi:hypothetical protein